jgi:hypothetical protein
VIDSTSLNKLSEFNNESESLFEKNRNCSNENFSSEGGLSQKKFLPVKGKNNGTAFFIPKLRLNEAQNKFDGRLPKKSDGDILIENQEFSLTDGPGSSDIRIERFIGNKENLSGSQIVSCDEKNPLSFGHVTDKNSNTEKSIYVSYAYPENLDSSIHSAELQGFEKYNSAQPEKGLQSSPNEMISKEHMLTEKRIANSQGFAPGELDANPEVASSKHAGISLSSMKGLSEPLIMRSEDVGDMRDTNANLMKKKESEPTLNYNLDHNKMASEKKSMEPQPEKSLTADEKSVIFEQDIIDDIDNLLQKSLSNSMNKFNLNSVENTVMSDRLSDISGNLRTGKNIPIIDSQGKSVSQENIDSLVCGDQNFKNEEARKQKNHIRKVSEVILNQINREFDVNLDSMLSDYQEKKSKTGSSRLFSPNSVKSNMTKKSSA